MLLAASFTITWASFLTSLFIALFVVGVVGTFSFAGDGRLNLKNWPVRPFVFLGILVLIGSEVGLAAAAANNRNRRVADQRVHAAITRDLKSEHFRFVFVSDETVVLLIGGSDCQLPPLSVNRTASRHDSTIKWRPVLSTTKRQVGLEATDLQSMAKACSAG